MGSNKVIHESIFYTLIVQTFIKDETLGSHGIYIYNSAVSFHCMKCSASQRISTTLDVK